MHLSGKRTADLVPEVSTLPLMDALNVSMSTASAIMRKLSWFGFER
jgi:hypothetical protein